ncbi:MAG: redoxin family protein [Prevotella sp.]|nr:redoxin family protein [Prevotella sp.]
MKKTIITALLAIVSITGLAQNKIGILAGTMWRNEQTGDWDIGFTEKYAIYDCRFWEYGNLKRMNDKFEVTLVNPEKTLKVSVGKQKDGRRQITIGNGKKQVYSLITSETLPDYPTKDWSTFKDNGYREGDTVTFVGWLKDLPKEVLDKKRLFEIDLYSIYTKEGVEFKGDIDDEGRFIVKVPVENSQEIYADWRRSHLHTVLEPGETYFYLFDYKNKKRLFMGHNARLQNELLAHNFIRAYEQSDEHSMTDEQIKAYNDQWMNMYQRNVTMLDSLLNENPTLSRKYADYQRMSNVSTMAQELLQSRLFAISKKLPQTTLDFIEDNLWSNIVKPYTVSREIGWFLYYYLLMAQEKNPQMQQNMTFDANTLLQMSERGLFKASAEDLATIKKWQNMMEQYKKASPDEAQKIEEQNKELIEELNILMQRPEVEDIVNDYFDMIDLKAKVIDSVYQDPVLRDIAKGQLLCSRFVERRLPLNQTCMDVLSEIQLPAIRNAIMARNDKLLAIQQAEVEDIASLHPSSDVEGLTDGEAILRKILEPYKGRIVYLDIWGTWCGPCKEKLSESDYVKQQLKEFDIVYLYLANRSPEESWKNVIKQYKLTGDNCVHYNLPTAQQRAVEEFLHVDAFPTYKLIDKQGNIHDLHWLHTDDMDSFKETLYRISSMQE